MASSASDVDQRGIDVPLLQPNGAKTNKTVRVNTWSAADVPQPQAVRRPYKLSTEQRSTRRTELIRRRDWEGSDEGRARLADIETFSTRVSLKDLYSEMGWVDISETQIANIGNPNNLYGLNGRSRTSVDSNELPDNPMVAPSSSVKRRFGDLAPEERRRAMQLATKYGVTLRSAEQAYGAVLDQAHMKAWINGYRRPWAREFFSDSPSRRLFDAGVAEIQKHPNWPRGVDGVNLLAVVHALTSRGTRFVQFVNGAADYPNHRAAMAVLTNTLDRNPLSVTASQLGIGVYDWSLRDATEAAMQMLWGGVSDLTKLRNSRGELLISATQSKVSAYVEAWREPHGANAHMIVDWHALAAFAPHLSTERSYMYSLPNSKGSISAVPFFSHQARPSVAQPILEPDGSHKRGPSELRKFAKEGGAELHAMLEFAAVRAHVRRGLAPSILSAAFMHRGQSIVWAQRQIDNGLLPMADIYPISGREDLQVPKALLAFASAIDPQFAMSQTQTMQSRRASLAVNIGF